MNRKVIYQILWATYESYVGLWELHWEVNSMLGGDPSWNIRTAKRVALYFLENELVDLFYDKWGEDNLVPISRQSAIEIVKGNEFWMPPQIGSLCVKVGITGKGERYYLENLIPDDALH